MKKSNQALEELSPTRFETRAMDGAQIEKKRRTKKPNAVEIIAPKTTPRRRKEKPEKEAAEIASDIFKKIESVENAAVEESEPVPLAESIIEETKQPEVTPEENSKALWENFKSIRMNVILEISKQALADLKSRNPKIGGFYDYAKKLREASGVKPKGTSWFSSFIEAEAEKFEDYQRRALKKITDDGKLEEFEQSLRK